MSYDIWIVLALPILLYYSPKLVRLFVSLILSYRKNSEKSSLKYQISEFRRELSKISQTDEFAKYSKIQRKLRSTTDLLSSINREDLELSFKYFLIGQAFIWCVSIILISRSLYAYSIELLY